MNIHSTAMKRIVITLPHFIPNEAEYINQLFESGIDLLHFRKPDATREDCERLLKEIPTKWHPQIVMHDHFDLCTEYHLHGIHLNRRNNLVPEHFSGSLSRSCHSLAEVTEALETTRNVANNAIETLKETRNTTNDTTGNLQQIKYDYVFLSPIFDSISKQGYHHAFTSEQLTQAAQKSIINERVIALGGITESALPQLEAWHFGGAAFLGDVWKKYTTK